MSLSVRIKVFVLFIDLFVLFCGDKLSGCNT